jgi:hypothetical protein
MQKPYAVYESTKFHLERVKRQFQKDVMHISAFRQKAAAFFGAERQAFDPKRFRPAAPAPAMP